MHKNILKTLSIMRIEKVVILVYTYIRTREGKPTKPGRNKTMKEMLNYYGYETIEEFGKDLGYYNRIDAERALKDMYEDYTAPEQK